MRKAMRYFFLFVLVTLSGIANSQTMEKMFAENKEFYISLDPSYLKNQTVYQSLSIAKITPTKVFAYINTREYEVLTNNSVAFDILPYPVLLDAKMSENIDSVKLWDRYPVYDDYIALMNDYVTKYPNLCSLDTIGSSIQGRYILCMKISDSAATHEAEPEFFYTSTMHGNEMSGYVLMLRLIDYLLTNYNTDSYVKSLVDNIEIYINPLFNPDGTYYGGNNTVASARRANWNGYDLNRNFPDAGGNQTPGGTRQPETTIMMNYLQQHNFAMSANFHDGDEVVNYPWDTWSRLHPDDTWFAKISKQYADTAQHYGTTGYFQGPYGTIYEGQGYTNGYAWYTVDGSRQDYETYYRHGREVTIELYAAIPVSATYLHGIWDANYRSLLQYMEHCKYGIHGIITDSATTNPVRAKITIIGYDADSSQIYSDLANGDFYRLLSSGTYDLMISAPGYEDFIINDVNVTDWNTTYLNITLIPIDTNENRPLDKSIQIYPNPCREDLTIINIESVAEITLYDMNGKHIADIYTAGTDPLHEITYDISYLMPGNYFILCTTNGKDTCKKFTKR